MENKNLSDEQIIDAMAHLTDEQKILILEMMDADAIREVTDTKDKYKLYVDYLRGYIKKLQSLVDAIIELNAWGKYTKALREQDVR